MAERHALIVGISEYHSSLGYLPKPGSDAKAVAQVLREHGKFNATLLPETVSSDDLKKAFERFLVKQSIGGDALIYFTGHGFTLTESENYKTAYLATSTCEVTSKDYDVSLQNGLVKVSRVIAQSYGIPFSLLNKLISESNFSSLVVLLDCCHSGYFVQEESVKSSLTAFASTGKNYFCISACQDSEVARAKRGGKHSVFTEALLEALKPERPEDGGEISSLTLFDRIARDPALREAGQHPTYLGFGQLIPIVSYAPLKDPQHPADPAIPTFNETNPYQGLKAFEETEAEYFGGREQAINDLQTLLNQSQFLMVVGPSGCGKSSLIKAGLIPRLKQAPNSRQWKFEKSFTPGEDPLFQLKRVVERHHQPNQPFVLFIDQFEELLTLCKDSKQRRQFIEALAKEVTNRGKHAKVIVAIRGAFLDQFSQYSEAIPLIQQIQPNQYIVSALTIEELKDAIEKPAKRHGVVIAPDLVSKIISDFKDIPVKADQYSTLPLLQYTLLELWDKCINDGYQQLTLEGYEEIGGVLGALQKRADSVFETFDKDTEQPLVKRLLLELAQPVEGQAIVVRRRETRQNLLEIAKSDQLLKNFLNRFSQDGLIVTNEDTVEVAHEQLFSAWTEYERWIEDNRENIRLRDRLDLTYREWLEHEKSDNYLLAVGPLLAIQEWVESYEPKLSGDKKEFLKKSQDKRDREINDERQLREKAEQARNYERQLRENVEREREREIKYERQLREKAEEATRLTKEKFSLMASAAGFAIAALVIFGFFQQQRWENKVVITRAVLGHTTVKDLTPKILQDAINIATESAEKNEIDSALEFYGEIRRSIGTASQFKSFDETAEKEIVNLINLHKMPILKEYLKISKIGRIVTNETGLSPEERFTEGALKETYKIVMIHAGTDLNPTNGKIDTQEVEKIPCDILKTIEKLWRDNSGGSCGWAGSNDAVGAASPDCNKKTKLNVSLSGAFGLESLNYLNYRLGNEKNQCKILSPI